MKACKICGRLYPDDAAFCPVDGQELYSATEVPVTSDDNDPRVGQLLLERYQVRRVVADGGMGRVYEALDMQQRRNVALKILHPEVAGDEVAVERFKREFEVSSQLPKNHIVDVTDFQPTRDGSYVLVMEFLYGEELRGTLKREKVLRPARVIRMLSQIAIGLDEAHAKKLVHRDLKPDNIFLCQTSDGDIAKVLDFGSVKDKGDDAKKLTVIGTTIGSPFYMAPEQAQGLDTLDHRADVWALAAIAYECVTGQVPFKGVNGPSILLEILTKDPAPPSEAGKDAPYPVPPSLDRALTHAFKKMASLRTPSVGALADEIGRAYGLSGDHTVWAKTPENELRAQLEAALPGLMDASGGPAAPADAADSFFGEDDALGGMDAAFDAAQSPPATVPQPAGEPAPVSVATEEALARAIEPRRPVWLVPALLGVGLVVLGIVWLTAL